MIFFMYDDESEDEESPAKQSSLDRSGGSIICWECNQGSSANGAVFGRSPEQKRFEPPEWYCRSCATRLGVSSIDG